MARVKGGYTTRRRRKKVLKLAKGYYGSKHTLYKTAHEQVMHSYSQLIHGLKLANVDINRKMLSEIAISDPKGFTEIVNVAKKALAN